MPRHADPAQSLEQLEGQRCPDPSQAAGGWYDDDLLYAVVTRRPQVWEQSPELAHEVKAAVGTLGDPSRYVRDEVESFLSSLPEWRPCST